MGMYNEVFKRCPKCFKRCTAQIGQIEYGFGGYDLDDPKSLSDRLTSQQLLDLYDRVKNEIFWCQAYHEGESEGCGHGFTLHIDEDKEKLARDLFGSGR